MVGEQMVSAYARGSEFGTNQPLVTVIIPSFNHEKYIYQSIESVVSQTYKNVEIIVIDDGSNDQSLKIIGDLAGKYGFIVIARDNRGIAKTLNEGIGLANGKYISFLGSDDYYLPQRIENAVFQLEQCADRVAFVYCDGYIVNDAGRKVSLFSGRHPRPLVGCIYDNLLIGNWIPGLGVTYKTDVLKQFMFDERFMIEDYTLFLRMFKGEKYKLAYYRDLGFAYRWHGNNISRPSELVDCEYKLIHHHFEDVGRYAEFKQRLKTRSFPGIEMWRWKNMYLLCLHLLRLFQKTVTARNVT